MTRVSQQPTIMTGINRYLTPLQALLFIVLSIPALLPLSGCDSSSKELNDLQQAVWRNPDDPQAYITLGNAYARRKQYEQAIGSYEKALTLNPRTAMNVYPALGAAYFNDRKYEQALDYFRKSLEFAPDDSLRHYDIGNVYFQLEQYQPAIEAYRQAIDNSRAFEEAYYNLAICYIRTGQKAKAREIYAWLQDKNNYLAVSLERHLEKDN